VGLEDDARRAAAESARRRAQEERARNEARQDKQHRERQALIDAANRALESWKAGIKRDVTGLSFAYHSQEVQTSNDWLSPLTIPAHLTGSFTCGELSFNLTYGYNRWISGGSGLTVTLEGIEGTPVASLASLGRALAQRDEQRGSSLQASQAQRWQRSKKRVSNAFAYGCALLAAAAFVIIAASIFINRP
jgi:hypothetical protein